MKNAQREAQTMVVTTQGKTIAKTLTDVGSEGETTEPNAPAVETVNGRGMGHEWREWGCGRPNAGARLQMFDV